MGLMRYQRENLGMQVTEAILVLLQTCIYHDPMLIMVAGLQGEKLQMQLGVELVFRTPPIDKYFAIP